MDKIFYLLKKIEQTLDNKGYANCNIYIYNIYYDCNSKPSKAQTNGKDKKNSEKIIEHYTDFMKGIELTTVSDLSICILPNDKIKIKYGKGEIKEEASAFSLFLNKKTTKLNSNFELLKEIVIEKDITKPVHKRGYYKDKLKELNRALKDFFDLDKRLIKIKSVNDEHGMLKGFKFILLFNLEFVTGKKEPKISVSKGCTFNDAMCINGDLCDAGFMKYATKENVEISLEFDSEENSSK